MTTYDKVNDILRNRTNYSPKEIQLARQWLMLNIPLSKIVETYLYDNERRPQKLDNFGLMRDIYDKFPSNLLLKCSRKTLKSTLVSNVITLNLIRYPAYKMMYVAPQDDIAKMFSKSYLERRMASPPLQKISPGYRINDVYNKILRDTESEIMIKYASDDPDRTRGPATDHNFYDEVQGMDYQTLGVIDETMAASDFQRKCYTGTPMTTTNTIHKLWVQSSQNEWAMRCGCGEWNFMIEEHDPMSMIREQGLSCHKCSKLLDLHKGQWVSFKPEKAKNLVGFHLAQPLIPHYSRTPDKWEKVYKKVHNPFISISTVYNEVFGLSFDQGKKLITEEQLRNCCQLGEMAKIYERNKHLYKFITCGVDWGVNLDTSRTTVCIGGLRDDNTYEVFYARVFREHDYDWQINTIANLINTYGATAAADSGPDPYRGIVLMQKTNMRKTQLVRYDAGNYVQHYMIPPGSKDPTQCRWCLNRSQTMTFTFNQLKGNKVLFPRTEDCDLCLNDILNVNIEVKESAMKQELMYSHADDEPDDFMHSLNFALCQAHMLAKNPLLFLKLNPSPQDMAAT